MLEPRRVRCQGDTFQLTFCLTIVSVYTTLMHSLHWSRNGDGDISRPPTTKSSSAYHLLPCPNTFCQNLENQRPSSFPRLPFLYSGLGQIKTPSTISQSRDRLHPTLSFLPPRLFFLHQPSTFPHIFFHEPMATNVTDHRPGILYPSV
jgi:hypothetical protein